MWSTPSLPLFQGPFLSGEVVPERVISMEQIVLFDI